MRRAHKSQAESLVKTIAQAHDEWKKLFDSRKNPNARAAACAILIDCQQGAIELGKMIENSEGEGFATVSLLEEYCELTYQIYLQLSEEKNEECSAGSGKLYKNLRRLWILVENSVKHDIKEQLEVVFLPYKASMWDSLESVWMAADEDEDCTAYVIPVPYYDKNPDNTLRQLHYEGNEYPDYVPVTRYEDYDFENRHPDMIFIHNPYDSNNYVTSVHPFFYAEHLKQFTEQLIYIPYFVLDEMNPNDQTAIKEMSHFCTTPGVFLADRVIVQSDRMRQIYIDVLTEMMGEKPEIRRYWEEKIDGSGSPKVDRILNTQKENLDIPSAWRNLLKKSDGGWKKIVFYNISVSALLLYNEQMLKKVKDVFRFFEKNKEQLVLLWRPHPLIESTLTSMRPALWEEYKKIREKYCQDGWGIYDDTADLNRAVLLSDAYYGDHSSVVQLYKKTGKQMMIQDTDISSCEDFRADYVTDDDVFTWSDHWHIENEHTWFVDGQRDILFEIDLKSKVCHYLAQLPNSNPDKFRLNPVCMKVENEIFCMPDRGDSIWIYNLLTSKFQQIEVNNPRGVRLSIYNCWRYGGNIYGVSAGLKKIIQIDIEKKEITQYFTFSDDEEEQIGICQKVGTDIFCVSSLFHHIYQFDMISKQITVHKIPDVEGGLHTISFDGSKFWLSGLGKKVYIWKKEDHSVITLTEFPNDFGIYDFEGKHEKILDCETAEYHVPIFAESIAVGESIWFIPFQTNKIICMDKKTHQIESVEIDDENETRESLSKRLLGRKYLVQYVRDDRYIGLFSFKNNCVLQIDTVDRTVKREQYILDSSVIGKLSEFVLMESSPFDRMIYRKSFQLNRRAVHADKKSTIGNTIYIQLKDGLLES